MKILSIYWGICSSAAVFVDDKIVAATHEERFTRRKNDDAFPQNAIDYCLREASLTAADLDYAVVASNHQDYHHQLTRQALWSIDDYLKEQKEYWFPTLYGNKELSYEALFKDNADPSQYPSSYWEKPEGHNFPEDRAKTLADYLGMDHSKAYRIEHHRGHAYYTYYASPFRNEKVLSFTVDGWGDGLNATIGIFDENGCYERVYETTQCNIGRIYRYMTLLLGMKPNEHEFKVMGLAPYGKEKYAKKALEVFKETLYVDGIDFKWKTKPQDSYFWFKERLEGIRFDNVAWGLQAWTEELLVDWMRNAVNKFGVRKIVVSGGVAMNIKAMGKIAELPEIEDMFVGGSGSDESLCIGSAICHAHDKSSDWDASGIQPIESLYLGPEATQKQEDSAVALLDPEKYQVHKNPSAKDIVELLAKGRIIAKCTGRMEFGQRALCNRTILADPENLRIKEKINSAIKNRDFWMPFAPVVMDRFVEKYIVNPKNIYSPHMTIGFDATDEGYNSMIAACHPADRSARPQILKKEVNPFMYEILEAFEKKTGRGALLNTSFNLHGYPIVNTPEDAVYVLENSGLDGLILNSYLVMKK
jgi:carbamoyltransferase